MIAFGTATAFMAAVAAAGAAVLQAAEARRAPRPEHMTFSLLRELARRRRWILGTLLLVAAWPLQVLALAWAPITVVQPTLATFPVILLLFARYGLHERVGRQDVWGVVGIMVGIALILIEAPHHQFTTPTASRLAIPLTVVGVAALSAYALVRAGRRGPLAMTIGAGLAYAWVDFADKLLSNSISGGDWTLSAIWLITILGMGTLAFFQENVAFQRRQATQVSPMIGALQDPLPVLMALWAGSESWGAGAVRITLLATGLALVMLGANALRRSETADVTARSTPSAASESAA